MGGHEISYQSLSLILTCVFSFQFHNQRVTIPQGQLEAAQ
jgi:hypothetical protein